GHMTTAQSIVGSTMDGLNKVTSSIPLKFKFDVTQIKSKIDEVNNATKSAFSALTGVTYSNTKPKKSKYYYQLKTVSDTAPSLTENEFTGIIPDGFFDQKFDTTRYLLDLLPPNDADLQQFLDQHTTKFTQSMDYINSKLHNKVRKNYTEFVEGMSQIHEIGVELQKSTVMCANGRRTLGNTKNNLNRTAFSIMAKYRKRSVYQKVLSDLILIKEIVHRERLIKQYLSDGDYPNTITEYHQCRDIAQRCQQYSCVPELGRNLVEIYNVLNERVDKDFFNCCRTFSATTYRSVFQAYKMLNRTNLLLEKLEVYFVKPIVPETRNIVYSHVLLSERAAMNPEVFKGVEYKDLCKSVMDEHFVNCLLVVFQYLSDVMTSLYLMNQYHVENPDREESNVFADVSSALTRFKKTIWDTMQKQVTALLAPRKLTTFKIDDFLLVLNSVTKISEIGKEFSGEPAHHLISSINDQSKSFFDHFHKTRIDDLKTMLEHETWTNIPVSSNFNAATELRLDKLNMSNDIERLTGEQIFHSIRDNGNPFSQLISYKNKRATTSSPTLQPVNQQSSNNTNEDKSDDEDEALKQEFVEEDDEDTAKRRQQQQLLMQQKKEDARVVLVSSTTIAFVRYIGKYLDMMKQLPHISYDIFIAVCQLVEYYLQSNNANNNNNNTDPNAPKWIIPKINPMLRLGDPALLFNLPVRVLAIETLSFVVSALEASRPVFESVLGKHIDHIKTFFVKVVGIIPDLQRHLVKSAVSAVFSHQLGNNYFSNAIANQKWDFKAATANNSPYVNEFVPEWKKFFKNLDDCIKSSDFITKPIRDSIVDASFEFFVQQLVDGYSRIKKCSVEGRSMMIQDLLLMQANLEKLAKRKIPNIAYAEHYIKGYYQFAVLSDQDIINWATEHEEYPIKHVINLLLLAKGSKPALQQQLEELDRKRR
ncbi:hypothetical protein SAMD00019534_112810, partial [Acytostelium subglobosum LB1]|uniref:hypothetical protein n=1 Tax=Acytostelium subglobosum LB1 TaxID=1410327 RepID=UPI000644ADC4